MNIFMRFPGSKPKALTFSYDDGVEQDEKLIDIFDRNSLKGTFNLNSGLYAREGKVYKLDEFQRLLSKKSATDLYSGSGHEVALHSLTHLFLDKLPEERILYEIIEDRKNLEVQFNKIIRGFAYPWGTYNNKTTEAIRKAGISYARTTVSTKGFEIPTDWLQLKTTCHHYDPDLMELARKFVEGSPEKEAYYKDPWLFYVWGHSYEFDIWNNWNVIEDFCSFTTNRNDIWYATNIDIYEYIEAYNRLEFSIDGKYVKNISALEVFFEYNEQQFEVAPGDEISIT